VTGIEFNLRNATIWLYYFFSPDTVLVTVKLEPSGSSCEVIVNTENIVIGSMLLKEITQALHK
jgi:hypothetical protein